MREASPRHAKSLAFGRLIALRPGEVALSFPKDAAFHRATVTASGRALLEKTLSEHFGQPTRIVEEEGEAEPSLAEEEARDRKARERQAEAEVRAHPAVRSALRILGGEIEYVQVLEEKAPEEEPDERS
ncbi:MAG: hypothetical protein HYZ28_10395 [Myxococcales bacterium]|nr:hypothetical protein [Myxococcales bacterium]